MRANSLFNLEQIKAAHKLSTFEATAHFDGCCIPNPGLMGAGIVIDLLNRRIAEHIALGTGTNNLAEWLALYFTIRLLVVNGIETAIIRGDSQLVINQMTGAWKIKDPTIQYLFEQCSTAMQGLRAVRFEWIRREHNKDADALSSLGARSNRV
jgi:ribonuclease HI